MTDFVHLHVHSNFSFLDGASHLEELVERAAELDMPGLAITDHDGLYGVVRFHQAAQARGIKPIIGAEMVVDEHYHLLLLARSRLGYANLCQIVSQAHLEHQDAPWVALEDVAPLSTDLLAIIPQRCGEVSRHILASRHDAALAALHRYLVVFGQQSLFLELQNHWLPDDSRLNRQLYELAKRSGIGCVATNNVHYAREEQYRLQDLMVCIKNGITVDDYHAERWLNSQYYLKSAGEMEELFLDYPEALANTTHIASLCQVDLAAEACRPPHYEVPVGETPRSFLHTLCQEMTASGYRLVTPEVEKQLAHELTVIEKLGLEEFFLCVWDICRFAREKGIRYAGRGSAANSLVAYVLGITTVNPLEHNLLFERFLHEELKNRMPDIDIDFDSARREEVIRYVEEKYTERHAAMVANVITYQTRLAVRETGKALGFPLHLVDRLAAGAYNFSAHDVRGYVEGIKEPKGSGPLELLIDLSQQLVGCPRHLSLHNGGMLLSREPLTGVVPVEVSTNGVRVCQFNKDDVEALGLIKFDLLGLKNFTIIEEALRLIEESRGISLDIDSLPYDDQATYDLLCSSQTIGVFQLESPGQWNLLSRTQPRTFQDLVVQVALFRPGPLQGQMVNPYVARKQGKEPVTYLHPSLQPILKDTLGIILFQEQVLEIAHQYAGLSYAEADGFRRAISHYRVESEMEAMRDKFLAGAGRSGRPREVSEKLFQQLSAYTGYGFCKSHAAAFARTVYQTAYLKAHYPAEFLAAILSNEPCDFFPPHVILDETKRLGIEVRPVDINKSKARFSVEDKGKAIRIGLMQVQNLSEETARHIVKARGNSPFVSLEDFYRRTNMDREAIESLIRVGAFDAICQDRRKLLWQAQEIARSLPGGKRHKQEMDLQIPVVSVEDLPDLPTLTERERAATDFKFQGMSSQYHVMSFWRESLARKKIPSIAELRKLKAGSKITVAGFAISKQRPPAAKGMAFIVLEDETGCLQVAIPPQLLERRREAFRSSPCLAIAGRLEQAGSNHVSVLAEEVWGLGVAPRATTDRREGAKTPP